MSPEACVAYLDQTLPFEFCWNALVSLKSNPKTIVFCVELDLQDLPLKLIVLYIALVPGLWYIPILCTFIGHPSVHLILHCMESMVIPLLYILHRSFFEDSTYCIAGPGILYTFIQLCCVWPSLSVYCIATTASIVYSPLVMPT